MNCRTGENLKTKDKGKKIKVENVTRAQNPASGTRKLC
jgi:hypothetical protein